MLPPPAEKLQNFFGVFLQFQIGVDKGIMDSEAALTEFKALCARYVSGIESLHHRADIFAGMSISQFDALGDSAYSVTTTIKEFFEKVHEIRHEMENEHES